MKKLEVFDPPMCCSTGICGSHANPTLVVFASDLEWLKAHGIDIVRYGLSLTPTAFSDNEIVKKVLETEGNNALPIILIDGKFISKASYPSRDELAQMCKIEFNEDEAPPVHREENCCCGVDCDCNVITPKEEPAQFECNCSDSAAEDNCYVNSQTNKRKNSKFDIQKILIIILSFILITIIIFKLILRYS
jgi:hypothetical protein